MKSFSKRLIGLLIGIACFGSITFALSQTVSYKPWGVPDDRREQYDQKVAQFDRRAALREQYQNKPRPIAEATPAEHDFGWVAPGETVAHSFTITNGGTAELQLAVPESLDERVAVELEHDRVAPGESTRCRVRWSHDQGGSPSETTGLHSRVESRQQNVTLKTNDPLGGSLGLTLRAQLRRELVGPDRIDFGKHDLIEPASVSFVVFSQQHAVLDIQDIHVADQPLEWFSEPFDYRDEALDGKAAMAARKVHVQMQPTDYGPYSGTLEITVALGERELVRTLPFAGRVRPPIGFYGPNVDSRSGVDFGTVEAGKRHDLFVTVRSRADRSRTLQILDLRPQELDAELTPLESEGAYRLRLSIPADCPNLRFNLDEAHGYVQIGDPQSPEYSSWLPVYGCVADTRTGGG